MPSQRDIFLDFPEIPRSFNHDAKATRNTAQGYRLHF